MEHLAGLVSSIRQSDRPTDRQTVPTPKYIVSCRVYMWYQHELHLLFKWCKPAHTINAKNPRVKYIVTDRSHFLFFLKGGRGLTRCLIPRFIAHPACVWHLAALFFFFGGRCPDKKNCISALDSAHLTCAKGIMCRNSNIWHGFRIRHNWKAIKPQNVFCVWGVAVYYLIFVRVLGIIFGCGVSRKSYALHAMCIFMYCSCRAWH